MAKNKNWIRFYRKESSDVKCTYDTESKTALITINNQKLLFRAWSCNIENYFFNDFLGGSYYLRVGDTGARTALKGQKLNTFIWAALIGMMCGFVATHELWCCCLPCPREIRIGFNWIRSRAIFNFHRVTVSFSHPLFSG